MSKISVVMSAYNAEKTIPEAIESTLKQSYRDFELIIIDDGSTDKTLNVIRSYKDKRIVLLRNTHDFIASLNKGLDAAKGKYIARMDADDVMHIDRLKIQHAIMEEEPEITVCGTWMTHFGENIHNGSIARTFTGVIENPTVLLLKGNFMFNPTTLIRRDFLNKYNLRYQQYHYAEDYKLWFEIAKRQGLFYIESQSLLYYRISSNQVSQANKEIQTMTSSIIRTEIIEYLIKQNASDYPQLENFYQGFSKLRGNRLLNDRLFFNFFYDFFNENKSKLKLM